VEDSIGNSPLVINKGNKIYNNDYENNMHHGFKDIAREDYGCKNPEGNDVYGDDHMKYPA